MGRTHNARASPTWACRVDASLLSNPLLHLTTSLARLGASDPHKQRSHVPCPKPRLVRFAAAEQCSSENPERSRGTRSGVERADFSYLKEKTSASAGNLSVQLDKLSTAGYIEVTKGFAGKRPQTTCTLTAAGRDAFHNYIEALKSYFPGATL